MLKRRVSYGLLAVLMLLLAAMAWTARDFAKLAAYFPITVATLGVALAFIELGLSRRAVTDPPTAQDDEEDAEFTKHLTGGVGYLARTEEHKSELQSLMRKSYAGFCMKKKKART